MKKKTSLLLTVLCLAAIALFSAGCKKDSGWKAQSAPGVSSSVPEQSTAKPTSFTVSSFLHDLFGGELPADTDRVNLPRVEDTREFDIPNTAFEGCAFGSSFYYLDTEDLRVFRLDLETGETSVFTDEVENPRLVCTDTDGVYVYDMSAKEIAYFSFDGERLASVPIPVTPRGGNGYSDIFYAVSLEHRDGLLLLAVRDGIWILADGDTEWKCADFSLLGSELISDAVIRTGNRLAVHIVNADHTKERLIGMDANGKNVLDLPGTLVTSQTISSNQGRLWAVDGRTGCRLYEIEDENASFVEQLSDAGHNFHVVKRAAISNGSILLFWYMSGRVTLMPFDESAPVRIIAASKYAGYADDIIRSVDAMPARYTVYDDAAYPDKLNMFLLAGEESFDIALVEVGASDSRLPSFLKNGAFVDLYGNADLKAHIGEMYPGARDMLEYRGQCPILPLMVKDFSFGFTKAAQDSGLNLPTGAWDFDDMKTLGDSLRGTGMSFFPDDYQITSMLMSLSTAAVEAHFDPTGDSIGEDALTALRDLFAALEVWRDDGMLAGSNPLIARAGMTVFGRGSLEKDAETLRLTTLPGAAGIGKQPLVIASYLIVNPKSKNLDAALAYLACLTDEDNRYNVGIFRCPFWPGLERYYFSGDAGRSEAVAAENKSFAETYEAFLPDYWAASELALVTSNPTAWQALRDFCSGTISGDDCAKVLYEEFVYKLKG